MLFVPSHLAKIPTETSQLVIPKLPEQLIFDLLGELSSRSQDALLRLLPTEQAQTLQEKRKQQGFPLHSSSKHLHKQLRQHLKALLKEGLDPAPLFEVL